MDGIVKSPIGFAISDQLGIPLFITCLEFFHDVSVGSSGKKKGALRVFAEIGVIMKRCQFVIDRHAADSRIDIMYRVVSAAQMCNRPDAGAAPWIVSAASCNRSNKQRGRLRQTVRCYCEYIDPRMVSSHHQRGKPHTPLNRRIMVRERQVWNITL